MSFLPGNLTAAERLKYRVYINEWNRPKNRVASKTMSEGHRKTLTELFVRVDRKPSSSKCTSMTRV